MRNLVTYFERPQIQISSVFQKAAELSFYYGLRRWAKSEREELDSLSIWVKSIRDILKSRIKHVRSKMLTIYPSAFHKPEVIKELNRMHEECLGSGRQSL
jgi:hypothetical protein